MALKEFYDFLSKRKEEITDKWFEMVINTYPHDTAVFFSTQKDEFLNPVGSILRKELRNIFSELLKEHASEKIKEYLDGIIRVRAVQDFSPSGAIVIFQKLKNLLWDLYSQEIEKNLWFMEIRDFEEKIDQLMLLAFDIYMKCREKLWELKVKEAYANISNILRLAGVKVEDDKTLKNQ